jgi:hypothetical protein
MTMPPVFGDFFAQAGGHIATAVSIRDELQDEALSGTVRGLECVVTTLARYVADVPLPDEFGGCAPAARGLLSGVAAKRGHQFGEIIGDHEVRIGLTARPALGDVSEPVLPGQCLGPDSVLRVLVCQRL